MVYGPTGFDFQEPFVSHESKPSTSIIHNDDDDDDDDVADGDDDVDVVGRAAAEPNDSDPNALASEIAALSIESTKGKASFICRWITGKGRV